MDTTPSASKYCSDQERNSGSNVDQKNAIPCQYSLDLRAICSRLDALRNRLRRRPLKKNSATKSWQSCEILLIKSGQMLPIKSGQSCENLETKSGQPLLILCRKVVVVPRGRRHSPLIDPEGANEHFVDLSGWSNCSVSAPKMFRMPEY